MVPDSGKTPNHKASAAGGSGGSARPRPAARAVRAHRWHPVLRWALLIWTVGYPLVALLGAVDGIGLGGRGVWLAGMLVLS